MRMRANSMIGWRPCWRIEWIRANLAPTSAAGASSARSIAATPCWRKYLGDAAPLNVDIERTCYTRAVECVSRERLVAAIASRRPEFWDSNPRLAERVEMRISDARRAHRQAHGGSEQAARCLAERHP